MKNLRAYACAIEGCDIRAYAKGLCNAHYLMLRNGVNMTKPIRKNSETGICLECSEPLGKYGGLGRCRKHYRLHRRLSIKAQLVEQLGGCCQHCRQTFPNSVYDFHHIGNKDEAISSMIDNASMEAIKKEVVKCILLCANCHRMEHNK